MTVYAVIHSQTNLCDNMIVWDDVTPWTPPPDHYVVANDDGRGNIGWTYNPQTGEWLEPLPPEPDSGV